MKRPARRLCLVHGKNKPKFCSKTKAMDIHSYPLDHDFNGECEKCGKCCTISAPVSMKEALKLNSEINSKGAALERVGVEPKKVINYMMKEKRIPLRMHVEATEAPELMGRHCSLLVPERAIIKQK